MKQPPPSLAARIQIAQEKVLEWLQCGMAPRQLAFTLGVGLCYWLHSAARRNNRHLCFAALVLRLNMPAIQAANWLAMPFQVVLLVPFLRLGQWLFRGQTISFNPSQLSTQIVAAPWHVALQMSGLFGRGLLAWLITAAPALFLMTLLLTPLMRHVSRLAPVAGD